MFVAFLLAPFLLVPLDRPGQSATIDPVEFYRTRQSAFKAYSERDFARAKPLLEKLTLHGSSDSDIQYRYGYSLYMTGSQEEGARECASAVERGYGTLSIVALSVAQMFSAAGNRNEAIAWLERALKARFRNRLELAKFAEFEPLKDDERFKEIVGAGIVIGLSRQESWSHDLDFYLQEVRRLHAKPDSVGKTQKFADLVEQLKREVPSLSDEQIWMRLQRLTAMLGDGHSNMEPGPFGRVDLTSLPIGLYSFPDGIYIISAKKQHADLVGSRVDAINGRPIANVFEESMPFLGRDNDQMIKWVLPRALPFKLYMRLLGIDVEGKTATLALTARDGKTTTEEVAFSFNQPIEKLQPPSIPGIGAPPLYLRDLATRFWLQPLPDLDAIYFQFNQVSNSGSETLAQFSRRLRREIDTLAPKHLIVDVRHNDGGNSGLLGPVVRLLTWFETDAPGNRVILITGRGTFSASQNFITKIEQTLERPIFAGEVSSSSPNHFGENTSTVLPYSKMNLGVSSHYFQGSHSEDRRPFIPVSLPVELTADDYFANRDPVMEAIGRLIREGF